MSDQRDEGACQSVAERCETSTDSLTQANKDPTYNKVTSKGSEVGAFLIGFRKLSGETQQAAPEVWNTCACTPGGDWGGQPSG